MAKQSAICLAIGIYSSKWRGLFGKYSSSSKNIYICLAKLRRLQYDLCIW